MSDVAGEAQKPSALDLWFRSMKSGTADQIEAVARAQPGVLSARALEDPRDRTRVVILVWRASEVTSHAAMVEAIQAVAAAGAVVEVIMQRDCS